jgi:hypothetical protein
MEVWVCNCSYIFIVSLGSLFPEGIIGPIFAPDSAFTQYWMHKPHIMTAHEWAENYADCADRWIKEKINGR